MNKIIFFRQINKKSNHPKHNILKAKEKKL